MPFAKNSIRTWPDNFTGIGGDPFDFDLERTPITALPETVVATPWNKRLLTCLLAMYMPAEGVDENLETALECWNFHVAPPPTPALPALPPRTETVNVVGVRKSPGLTIEV